MKTKKNRRPRHRFTGKPPPPALLLEFPNWIHALDEEDVEGQDESTLRPGDEQAFISEDTAGTAVSGIDAAGRPVSGLLFCEGLRSGLCDTLWIWPGDQAEPVFVYTVRTESDGACTGCAELRTAGLTLPLRLRARVPLDPGEPCPELALNADGLTVVLPDPAPGTEPAAESAEPSFPWRLEGNTWRPLDRLSRFHEWRERAAANAEKAGHVFLNLRAWKKYDENARRDVAALCGRAEAVVARQLNAEERREWLHMCALPRLAKDTAAWDAVDAWGLKYGITGRWVRLPGPALASLQGDATMSERLAARGMAMVCFRDPAPLLEMPWNGEMLPYRLNGANRMLAGGKLPLAKRLRADGLLVAEFAPRHHHLHLAVFGAGPLLAMLARGLLPDTRLEEVFGGLSDSEIMAILAHEWDENLGFLLEFDEDCRPRPIVLRALRAAQARPNHAQTASAGISAAEMVAARHTGQPLPPGLEDLHKAAGAMPPPDAALLSHARAAVRAVALGCACEQATFLTEPARQAWRDGLAHLHARLGG